jgi:dihydrofolate reductase
MIKIIVAMDPNKLIGKNNKLPWDLKEDLAHFKATTTGHAVVMGRKTFESIGKALPNRVNYLLTRDQNLGSLKDMFIVHDYKELVSKYQDSKDILFVIGGEQVYQLFLPYCDELIVSQLLNFYYGDTYFPEFEENFEIEQIIPKIGFNVVHYRRKK